MKPITSNIIEILENKAFQSNLENLKARYPNHKINETSILEVYNSFLEIKNLLIDSIKNRTFEKLPFNHRRNIKISLETLLRNASNSSLIIPHFNSLESTIYDSRLLELNIEKINFKEKFKEVNSIGVRYKKILKDIQDSEKIKESIDEIKTKVNEDAKTIYAINDKANELELEFTKNETDIEKKITSITKTEQEIENRKQKIIAFHANIEGKEKKLEIIDNKLSDKLIIANSLIKEAENALELKQTEGIAKAYSSRLSKIYLSKNKLYWLIGASIFVTITLIFGILLTGIEIKIWELYLRITPTDNNNIGFILGRIVLTFIGISGAVFCSNRFVILRNLEEDYEYKVVLTKSILAFSKKIREIDKTQVAKYLTQVLNELHKDPLRNRKWRKSTKNEMDLNKIDNFLEIFKKIKCE